MTKTILKAERVQKVYQQGERRLEILKGVDLAVDKGDALAILGASGAGKSTLMHILGILDRPTLGNVFIDGEDVTGLSDDEQAKIRSEKIGFVFQFHHLLPEFTALENVLMPVRIAGQHVKSAEAWANELFEFVGLKERMHHYPNQLSGGELQRVAIIRALIRRPLIVFADEPTGALDAANSDKVKQLFFALQKKLGITLVVVTHNQQFAEAFPKVLTMADGQWVRNQ